MATKNVKTRIKHKHDTAAKWDKATSFIPLAGELIVYDADSVTSTPRFKVGDGVTPVVDLPFSNNTLIEHDHNDIYYTAAEADLLLAAKADAEHGKHVSYSDAAPVQAGVATAGSADTLARSDHKHPTDTSRASKIEFDTHATNNDIHITATERTHWADANSKKHSHKNAEVLDNTTACFTAEEKAKLEGITPGANAYEHPVSKVAAGTYSNVEVDKNGHVIAGSNPTVTVTQGGTGATDAAAARSNLGITPSNIGAASKDHVHGITDVTNLLTMLSGLASAGHTHPVATSQAAGLMSTSDKSKLDNIIAEASKTSFEQVQLDGTKIGTININGTATDIFAPSQVIVDTFTGATANTPGTGGAIPAPAIGDNQKYLKGDGKWTAIEATDIKTFNHAVDSTPNLDGGTAGTITVASELSKYAAALKNLNDNAALNLQAIGSNLQFQKGLTTETIAFPSASLNGAGMMSASDKEKLDSIAAYADHIGFVQTLTSGTKIGTLSINNIPVDLYAPSPQEITDTDTKNTAGATDSSAKLFLIGAQAQADDQRTYSHNTAYVGTNGHLYSNSKQVVNLSDAQALTNKTYNGYTLGEACAKNVDTEPTQNSTNLITSGAIFELKKSVADGKALLANTISGYGYSSPTATDTFEELADAVSDSIYLAQASGTGKSNIRVANMPGLNITESVSGNYRVLTSTITDVDSSFPYVTFILPGALSLYGSGYDPILQTEGYAFNIYGYCAQGQAQSVASIDTVCDSQTYGYLEPQFNLSWVDSNTFNITLKIDNRLAYNSDMCFFIFSDTQYGINSGGTGSLIYMS